MSGAKTKETLLPCLWQGEKGSGLSSKGPAASDPLLFLYQGDRGAPGELGETGEKVRWCQSRPALASPGVTETRWLCLGIAVTTQWSWMGLRTE